MVTSRRFFNVFVVVFIALLAVFPGVASAAPVSSADNASSAASACWYRVRYGDTLSSIASRYGVGTSWLQQYNGLPNRNFIYAGQNLRVPCGSSNNWNPGTYPGTQPVSYPITNPTNRRYYYSSYYGCWGYSYFNARYGRDIYICTR